MTQFDSDNTGPQRPPKLTNPMRRLRNGIIGVAIGLIVLSIPVLLGIRWYIIRVEVEDDQVLILVNKTGRNVSDDLGEEYSDQIVLYPELVKTLAQKTGMSEEDVKDRYRGIQFDVLQVGRHYPNPYKYERIVRNAVIIGENEVGVLIRRYGKPLPFPKTVATEPDERGPVAEILEKGKHQVNLLAYEVKKFPVPEIPPGHVGVVTMLSGHDPKIKNTYTVGPGEKGVQRDLLRPGRVPHNPYLQKIDIVDIRNRTYHMLGEDTIHFPSNDSFTIDIEGTIEWSIDPDRVAEVTVAYGDEQDIINKIILPYARSISRIEGSKLQAREFISGKTRTAFQERLREQLREACGERGILVHSALVREITPPAEIARLISQREQADQEIERSRNQIEEAKAEALLVEQREMQARNTAIGNARRDTVSMTKKAEQQQVVDVTQANRELEVAKLNLEAATKQAAAIRSRGKAEANVILFEYQAKAEPLTNAVNAFGDGETYAQYFFLQKVAPSIRSILSNTEGPFADIFKNFQKFSAPEQKDTAKGSAQ